MPDGVWRIRHREVEQAHVLDVLTGEAAVEPSGQVLRQSLDERGSVLGPLLARLLELDDAASDQPVRGGHGGVHRADCRFPGRVDDLRHVPEDCLVRSVLLAERALLRREWRQKMGVGHSGPGCRRWGTILAALGFRLDVVASEFRPWKGILLGRGLPLPGCVFEQQGEEAAQPVLRVGGGPGDDPDHTELGGVLFGHPSPVLSALFLHISLRRAGVSTRPAVTAGLAAPESEGSWGGTPCRIWEVTRVLPF